MNLEVIFVVIWSYNNFWTKNTINLIKTNHRKFSWTAGQLQKSIPIPRCAQKLPAQKFSICHTFASFGTIEAKLIEPIFQSFYIDRLLYKISLPHPRPFKSDRLLNFYLFLTNFHCHIFWTTNATDYFPKLVWRY